MDGQWECSRHSTLCNDAYFIYTSAPVLCGNSVYAVDANRNIHMMDVISNEWKMLKPWQNKNANIYWRMPNTML